MYHLIDLEKPIFLSPYFRSDIKYQSNDMPLGMLSRGQIRKGIHALKKMMLDLGNKKLMIDHTDKFYSITPHILGRNCPSYFKSIDTINKKIETLKKWMNQSVLELFEN